MPLVKVQPGGRSIRVVNGELLLKALGRAGVNISVPCGGKGVCGKCAVRLISGQLQPTEHCREALSLEKIEEGWRLACCVAVDADVEVEVPAGLRISGERIVSAGAAEFEHLAPRIITCEVDVPAPDLEDQRSDLERLLVAAGEGLAGAVPQAEFLYSLAAACRADSAVQVVAVECCDGRKKLLRVEAVSAPRPVLGMCFDLGTTTIVGELWDLQSGRRLSQASRGNPQRVHGDDVISRIEYATSGSQQRSEMSVLVVGALNEIIEECCAQAGKLLAGQAICEIVISANTIMNHLLLGISAENISMSPFTPVFTSALEVEASDIGLSCLRGAPLLLLPAISGYVGSDIVAGILATGLLDDPQARILFVDIGTNGELVLVHDGQVLACAAAAGPAFEGARISSGCRAMSGAIEEVVFDGQDLFCATIDDAAAIGICGSGLIDAVAALRRSGVLDETGRLLDDDELPSDLPEKVRSRVIDDEKGRAVLLGFGREISLTQRDIREMQLGKAAIRAGAEILLEQAGLSAAELDRVIIGGAFGNYVDRDNALEIGLLPEVSADKVVFAGNTSAAGARLILLDARLRQKATECAAQVNYLELSGRVDFQGAFAEAMSFPEPEQET